MPVNRNALIRYKTIDLCLQNRYRKWTLEDLIETCSEALYEYEGIDKGVSRRTIQMDLQLMRSDKLGYNAPIVVQEKKYYTYEDPKYSIMNIPISEGDLNKLTETVDFLKQFKGFSHFRELDTMVQKLEDHVYSRKINRKPVIDFEKNDHLKGLEFLEILYQTIIRKHIIELTYQSFNARQANTFLFYPYLLKEFRNRWFLIGSKNNRHPFLNLAIDRIVNVRTTERQFAGQEEFDAAEYFRHVIGVTVSEGMKPEKVVLFVNRKHAPYVLTKPFHPSQKLVEKNEYGITISLEVQLNFELEKEIMGLGDGIVVLEPERLRSGIAEKLNNAIDLYNTTIPAKGIVSLKQKYFHKGFCVINQLFSHRSIMQLGSALSGKSGETGNKERSFSIDLNTSNPVKSLLFPPPVWKTLSLIVGNPGIKTAMYWGYVPESFCEYSQLMTSGTILFIVALSGLKPGTLTLQLIPGSHNKQLSDEEKQCITGNCIPVDCPINSAGAILLNPAVLHRFHPSFKNAPVKFVVIEMTYKE